jgi:hypothetical protein
LQRLPPGETIRAFNVSETSWGFDEYDVASQGLISHHFELVDERVERLSIPFRDAWPAEGGRGGSGLVRCPRVVGPAGAGGMGAVRSFAARWRRTVRLEENWRP